MKFQHILIAFLVVFTAGWVFAQSNPVEQSNFLVGGKIYFQSQTGEAYEDENGESTTTFSLNPDFGLFFADGFYLGAAFEMQSIDTGEKRRLEYSIGPKIGYFYNSDKYREDNQGALFPYAAIFFTVGDFQNHDAVELNYTKTTFGVNFGAIKMISPALGLDIALKVSYDSFETKDDNSAGMNGVTARFGLGLVGFFGKRFNL